MKGIRPYLVLLGLLTALALYFFLGRRSGTFAPSENDFAVTDTGKIESVWISFRQGEMLLERREGRWLVNGYPVRKESLRSLFMVLSRLEAGAPVSKSTDKRVREGLADHSTGIRIRMEDKREKAFRVYYDSLSASTFMVLEGSDQPFHVRVRGYRQQNLQELFPADPGFWRGKIIFHCLPSDIRYVSLINTRDPGRSFHLSRDEEGNFKVAAGKLPGSWMPATAESVSQYLGYFYDVRFESFLDPEKDTLHHSNEPEYILSLELVSRERIGVELFPVYHYKGSRGGYEPDLNRLYAHLDRGDEWIVVKYIQVDLLLKDFEYFAGF
jgi:hypothetical protein